MHFVMTFMMMTPVALFFVLLAFTLLLLPDFLLRHGPGNAASRHSTMCMFFR